MANNFVDTSAPNVCIDTYEDLTSCEFRESNNICQLNGEPCNNHRCCIESPCTPCYLYATLPKGFLEYYYCKQCIGVVLDAHNNSRF